MPLTFRLFCFYRYHNYTSIHSNTIIVITSFIKKSNLVMIISQLFELDSTEIKHRLNRVHSNEPVKQKGQ